MQLILFPFTVSITCACALWYTSTGGGGTFPLYSLLFAGLLFPSITKMFGSSASSSLMYSFDSSVSCIPSPSNFVSRESPGAVS